MSLSDYKVLRTAPLTFFLALIWHYWYYGMIGNRNPRQL